MEVIRASYANTSSAPCSPSLVDFLSLVNPFVLIGSHIIQKSCESISRAFHCGLMNEKAIFAPSKAGGGFTPKMVRRRRFFSLFFMAMCTRLLVLHASILCVAGILPVIQRNSLLSLYYSTGGPFWLTNTNWGTATDPCTSSWYGVACDSSNQNVDWLKLDANRLVGPLPDLELPRLQYL